MEWMINIKEDVCNKRARGMRTKSFIILCEKRNFFEKKTVLKRVSFSIILL